MLGIFVKSPWPNFYKNGMKTWEIRSYPTDYRRDVVLIEPGTNKIICKMFLKDCIPLNKERWEMNFEKHRTSCSYEELPYKKDNSPAFAWILEKPFSLTEPISLERLSSRSCIEVPDSILNEAVLTPICFSSERIACKFIGNTMLLYWMKKNYFALVGVVNLESNTTQIITAEIKPEEVDWEYPKVCVNLQTDVR